MAVCGSTINSSSNDTNQISKSCGRPYVSSVGFRTEHCIPWWPWPLTFWPQSVWSVTMSFYASALWVSAWVHASERPVNLRTPYLKKTIKGISPNFGHRCIWVFNVLISFGVKRFWPFDSSTVTAGNDPKTLSTLYLTNQWRKFHPILVTDVFGS